MQEKDAIAEVFTFWRDLHSNGNARLDDRRRRLITARLHDGYSADDIRLAILGCKASAFHQGDNDHGRRYCSIDLICRNAEKIDQFIDIAETHAARLAARAAEAAARTSSDAAAIPMPDSVRAKITALLGRFAPKQMQPRSQPVAPSAPGKATPNAALAD